MWAQICTMPRKLSKGLAEFCLIGGPPNSRRILLWGIAMSPRSSIAIAQLFFSMACPNVYSNVNCAFSCQFECLLINALLEGVPYYF